MKQTAVPVFLAMTALLMSCANKVYVERDESANLAKYKTYAWVDMRDKENDSKNVTSFAEDAVRRTAREELEKRGWRETNMNPDVLLSYDVLVERSTQQQSDPVYSQPFTRYYYNPWSRRWAAVYYPSQFVGYDTYDVPVKEGTVTLTLTDPDSDKAIWQGWTTETMSDQKIATSDLEKSIRSILKKLNK